MGYRIYLGQINNKKYEKIKNMKSYKELYDKLIEIDGPNNKLDEECIGVYKKSIKMLGVQ